VRDELANDRTFLAWLRTGIACFALGFVVAKAALIIRSDGRPVPDKALYSATGVLLVLSGGALVVAGNWQHRTVLRGLTPNGLHPQPRWPQVITAIAVVVSLALSTLIVVST
jgi:putative membrane protein